MNLRKDHYHTDPTDRTLRTVARGPPDVFYNVGRRPLIQFTPLIKHLNQQHLKPEVVLRPTLCGLRRVDTNATQLSATDILALATMKNAAKCDT